MTFRKITLHTTTILVVLLLSTIFLSANNLVAIDEKQLFLVYYDSQTQEQLTEHTKIFYEGQNYDIEVGSIGEIGYIYDTTITVPWGSYKTTREVPWVSITTPSYEEYSEGFILTASKQGYTTIEEYIQIFKGKLSITQDQRIVTEGDHFTITITNQNDQPIENVQLYLECYGQDLGESTTNENGIAFIQAPNLQETTDITIRAFKKGYQPASSNIHIEHIPGIFFSQHVPLLVAFLILLSSMIIVRLRKKTVKGSITHLFKTTRKKNKTYHKSPSIPPQSYKPNRFAQPTATVPIPQRVRQRNSRVEEIRLSAASKKQETRYISPKPKQKENKPVDPHKWIEGTSNVKYKIDEITGEIDPKKKDKWFEGIDNIKDKVDKKLKKNYKQEDA